jgi:hypothetical protein
VPLTARMEASLNQATLYETPRLNRYQRGACPRGRDVSKILKPHLLA